MLHSELKELQSLQYDILKYIDRICKKNNIEYFLVFGTLLGAVRHKGTIPWDYDIDIAMTRDNHKKFLECAQRETEGHTFSGLNYNPTMDYCGESRVFKYDKKYHNVYVDIFILDYARMYSPKGEQLVNYIINFLYMAKLSKNEKKILKKRFKGSLFKQTYLILTKVANFCLGGSARVERFSYYLKARQTPSSKFYVGDYCGFYTVDTFRPAVFLKYEDAEYPCPRNYDGFLTQRYGNWKSYPREGLKWLEEENKGINL